MLWTRADLSFALVNNLQLLTHYKKRAENERCFSRQNRDEKKTEMRKNIQVERNLHLQRGTAASYKLRASTGCASIFDHIIFRRTVPMAIPNLQDIAVNL